MPVISRFYGEYSGLFSLHDGEMFEGDIPIRGQQMVKEFVLHYKEKLLEMWNTQKFEVLEPLE